MRKYRQLNVRVSEEDLNYMRNRIEFGNYKTTSEYIRSLIKHDRRFNYDDTERVDDLIKSLYRINGKLQKITSFIRINEIIDSEQFEEKMATAAAEKMDNMIAPMNEMLAKIYKLLSVRGDKSLYLLFQTFYFFARIVSNYYSGPESNEERKKVKSFLDESSDHAKKMMENEPKI